MIDADLLVLALRGVLLFCLYGFLLFALIVVWRDTGAPAVVREADMASAPPARLVVLDPGGSGLPVGIDFVLAANSTVGRAEPNSIVIPDPAVSARHCRFSVRDGQWWLEDLGSANGTYINGKQVVGVVQVSDGDVVEVSRVSLSMEIT